MDEKESSVLRSKILTLEQREGRGCHSKYNVKAFTEKGLYMLATILKSPRAVEATLAIIDTFTMTRQLARTMESLQTVEDGGEQQKSLLQKIGEILVKMKVQIDSIEPKQNRIITVIYKLSQENRNL